MRAPEMDPAEMPAMAELVKPELCVGLAAGVAVVWDGWEFAEAVGPPEGLSEGEGGELKLPEGGPEDDVDVVDDVEEKDVELEVDEIGVFEVDDVCEVDVCEVDFCEVDVCEDFELWEVDV